jgi:hypothetical protein
VGAGRPGSAGKPVIGGQVELVAITVALDAEASKARVHLQSLDGEAGLAQRALDRGDEPVDGIGRQAEEVEVAGLPPHLAAGDQGGAAASANPSASSKPPTISATRCCSGLST